MPFAGRFFFDGCGKSFELVHARQQADVIAAKARIDRIEPGVGIGGQRHDVITRYVRRLNLIRVVVQAIRLTTSFRTGAPIRFEVPPRLDVRGCADVNCAFDNVIQSHIAERYTSLGESLAICVVTQLQRSNVALVGRPLERAMCQFGPGSEECRVAISRRHISVGGVKNVDTKVRHFGRKERKDRIDRDVHGQRVGPVARTTIPLRESIESGLVWISTALHWSIDWRQRDRFVALRRVTGKREDRNRCNVRHFRAILHCLLRHQRNAFGPENCATTQEGVGIE
jgi:hypothetical protein